jgi:NAD(P)-dependent dehydrogenase (short-subunit alcohol dehydrogenase family)
LFVPNLTSSPNSFDLRDRTILLTGGAGLLGREFAAALAAAQAHVVIADIETEAAQSVATEITAKTGVKALGLEMDVSDRTSVHDAVKQTLDTFGQIDVLINNAAIDPKFDPTHQVEHMGSFEDYPLELWNQSLAVNLTGMFLCAQAVARPMLAQGKGVIINISSIYGLVGPDQRLYENSDHATPVYKPVTYSVTKSAVTGLTRYLATYWAGKSIRVNTLTLGGVFNQHEDEFVQRYSARTPSGRMAQRSEYNGALLFLASDASAYMTGANLIVDGGWTAW